MKSLGSYKNRFATLAATVMLACSPALASAQYQVPGLGSFTGSNLSVAEAREAARLHDVYRNEVGITQKIEWSNELATP